jgi:hypothetical protein
VVDAADELSDLIAAHKHALDVSSAAEAALLAALEVHYADEGVPRAINSCGYTHLINAGHVECIKTHSYAELYYFTDLPAVAAEPETEAA